MSDTLDSAVLLESVAQFLRKDLLPVIGGPQQFNLRVSLSAIELVARVLRLQRKSDEQERARLSKLLEGDSNLVELRDMLCDQISAGKLTEDSPALLHHLWATVVAQLAIDQPGYSTYLKAIEDGIPIDSEKSHGL